MNTSEPTVTSMSVNGLFLKVDLYNMKKAALVLRALESQTEAANHETD